MLAPVRQSEGSRAAPVEHYPDLETMQLATALAQGLSIVAFAWYGTSALLSRGMVAEFERYGLGRLRVLTASLQIVGSLGLLAGHFFRPLLLLSAGGFTAMMLLALLVRIRIRDPTSAMVPAFVLMCLNLFLVVRAIGSVGPP